MKEKLVPSAWLEQAGHRLDCGPYLSGAIEARVLLQRLPVKKRELRSVTLNGEAGIFNGPRFARNYVSDPRYGVPFLGSTDILAADLSRLPLLSQKLVSAKPNLLLKEGWTLITCSGTIGRTVFARSDMTGLAGSQHFMRVVPDPSLIRPGFLFAFLRSRFGVPLVIGGTYGAIIQHIEPEHLSDLPVPMAPEPLQERVHKSVTAAATARVKASALLRESTGHCLRAWGVNEEQERVLTETTSPDVVVVSSSGLKGRFDAFYHSTAASKSDDLVRLIGSSVDIRPIGDVVERVFETPRFGRIPVTDRRYGSPFMSISDLACFSPESETLVSTRQVIAMEAAVGAGWLILPRVGQLNGLFGHVVCIPPHLDGIAVSDNNIRIVAGDRQRSGYLFAALSTKTCYLQIIRRACGTSIPYLDSVRVREVPVPWPKESARNDIADIVNEAMDLRSSAVSAERGAIALVEDWIEKKGGA